MASISPQFVIFQETVSAMQNQIIVVSECSHQSSLGLQFKYKNISIYMSFLQMLDPLPKTIIFAYQF